MLTELLTITGTVAWLGALTGLAWSVARRLRGRATLDLAGRWIVVTGCDSGIGAGVLEALVGRGAAVIALTYTEAGAGRALALGARLAPRLDLTDAAARAEVVASIEAACAGNLWALVHNAGVVLPGFVDYQPLENYRRSMEVNFLAPVALTRPLLPLLRRTRGRIVVVSSVDGIVSLPGNAPYDASKFAVDAWADALRAELALWGVQVSVINPSTLRTPLALGFFDGHVTTWEAMQRLEPDGEWSRVWPRAWLDAFVAANGPNLARIAQDPVHAVNDIVHAVGAEVPKLRYLSGTLAKTLFRALWLMPEGWALRLKRGTINPKPPV